MLYVHSHNVLSLTKIEWLGLWFTLQLSCDPPCQELFLKQFGIVDEVKEPFESGYTESSSSGYCVMSRSVSSSVGKQPFLRPNQGRFFPLPVEAL